MKILIFYNEIIMKILIFYFMLFFFCRAPFVWTDAHDELLVREILVIEPYKCKRGSAKRGDAWTEISDVLNLIENPKFRVNQRAIRDRFNLLEKSFKKKNVR